MAKLVTVATVHTTGARAGQQKVTLTRLALSRPTPQDTHAYTHARARTDADADTDTDTDADTDTDIDTRARTHARFPVKKIENLYQTPDFP